MTVSGVLTDALAERKNKAERNNSQVSLIHRLHAELQKIVYPGCVDKRNYAATLWR